MSTPAQSSAAPLPQNHETHFCPIAHVFALLHSLFEQIAKLMKMLFNLAIASLVAGSSFVAAAPTPPTKPNIVYILADDMGYADVGFNGSKDFHTPNLDRLAKDGTILTAMYGQPGMALK